MPLQQMPKMNENISFILSWKAVKLPFAEHWSSISSIYVPKRKRWTNCSIALCIWPFLQRAYHKWPYVWRSTELFWQTIEIALKLKPDWNGSYSLIRKAFKLSECTGLDPEKHQIFWMSWTCLAGGLSQVTAFEMYFRSRTQEEKRPHMYKK